MQVKGFERVLYFSSIKLVQERNEHSYCSFTAAINEEPINYLSKVGHLVSVTLDDERPVFYGLVDRVEVEKTYGSTFLNVALISCTQRLDTEEKTRIFQNPHKRLGEVLSASRLRLTNCELELAEDLRKQIYEKVIVQDKETDFQFIKRMAAYQQQSVWLKKMTEKGIVLSIAKQATKDKNTLKNEDIIAYTCINTKQGMRLELRVSRYLPLGSTVTIETDSKEYLIVKSVFEQLHNKDEFVYILEEKVKTKINNENEQSYLEKSLILQARVTSVADPLHQGKIQVEFIDKYIEDMDKKPEKRIWLDYRSPYSGKVGGIVFLPDVGDVVEVVYNNEGCYVGSTLRQQVLDKECQNVEEKYIGNNFQQRVFWKKDGLELHSFENKILMNKERIEIIVGASRIVLDKDNIFLETGSDKIQLMPQGILTSANKTVDVKGQDVQISAQSNLEVKASSASYKSSGGTSIKGSAVDIEGSPVNIC